MERDRARRVFRRLAAGWLMAVAVLAWLAYAEIGGTTGRAVRVASTCVLAPLFFDWGAILPLPDWRAEWLANFVISLLSILLLSAYAIRPSRATAGLSIAGAVSWCWLAGLSLAS
jgi:hypothetical protein